MVKHTHTINGNETRSTKRIKTIDKIFPPLNFVHERHKNSNSVHTIMTESYAITAIDTTVYEMNVLARVSKMEHLKREMQKRLVFSLL